MFHQLFRLATLAKFATAATLIAGAYGTGNIDMPESRPLDSSLHAEKTPETAVVRQPEPTAKPEKTAQPATATKPVTSERYSFENLLKECVTRYTQHLDDAKTVCEAAIRASGLDTDSFWAKYRAQFTTQPQKTQPVTPTSTFEGLLKECVARYARAASNTKEACEAAIRASGLDTDAFWAKYRSLMIPPAKHSTEATPTKSPTPSSTPKPATSVQLSPECLAKYEAAKAAKNGPADVFEAAVRSFNESCRTSTATPTTSPRPSSTPKPATSVQLSPECLAKYEAAKAAKNGPADVFEAAVRSFNQSCRTSSEVRR